MNKKLLISAALISFSFIGFSQVSWDDFDNPGNIDYTFVNGALNQSFSNPSTGGINASALCAKYDRNPSEQYDVVLIEPTGTLIIDDVSDYLSGAKKMSMKIFSPLVGVTVQITLENSNTATPSNYPTGRHSEYTATTSSSLTWETIEFAFNNQPDNTVANTSVNRMVILFNPNSFTDDAYVFDDLMGPEFADPCSSVATDVSIGEDFECQRNVAYDFVNGDLAKVTNPRSAGINTSENVGHFTKWTTGATDGAFGGALDNAFTTGDYATLNIMLYDPNAPQDFLIILQDGSNNDLLEKTFTTSSTTDWEEFKVNISSISPSTSIEKYVLLLNPATTTADEIYYDNFKFTNDAVTNSISTNSNTTIELYPNPIKEKLNISSESTINEVKIYDVTGKIISSQITNGKSVAIETNSLPEGIYLVEVMFKEKGSAIQKIIK